MGALSQYAERMRHHIKEFQSASADWEKADRALIRKWGTGAELRIARRDDLDRGDAFKAADFHMGAATMYASALAAEIALVEASRGPRGRVGGV